MRAVIVLMALSACGSHDGEPAPEREAPWRWETLSVDVVPAFDPELDGFDTLEITVSAPPAQPPGCRAAVRVVTAAGGVRDLEPVPLDEQALLAWDGQVDDHPVDPGPIQIVARADCPEAVAARYGADGEARTYALRLGVGAVDWSDAGEGTQVPLAWHKADLLAGRIRAVSPRVVEYRAGRLDGTLSDLDQDDGQPRPALPPWEDPAIPPWGPGEPEDVAALNLPVGFVAGARPVLAITPGLLGVSGRTGAPVDARGPLAARGALPVVRLVADGLTALDDPGWSPGRPVRFRADDPLPDTLGRHEVPLELRFEVLDGEIWRPIPGVARTAHHVWILAGPTAVPDGTDDGAAPSASWVGVLEDVRPAVEGLPADDPVAILDALRDHLHDDPWIAYNPNDAAYSSFAGRYIYWDRIWVEMSDWLDRQQGIDVYCHSLACLLSAQANHLGLETEYITLVHRDHPDRGQTFRTVLTRAAGTEGWRSWRFNSHGIVRHEGLVWDAAVDLDQDADPAAEPVDPLGPRGLPFEDYQALLSTDELVIVNQGRCDNY